MVKIDLNVKSLVGLFSLNSMDQKDLEKNLDSFTKEDLIKYIINEAKEYDETEPQDSEPDDPSEPIQLE